MQILLTRHTETNYNLLGLGNADPTVDVHLSVTGLKQAEKLSKRLQKVPFEIIIVSELPRTRQTADIINAHHNVDVLTHPKLNDIRMGFEGQPVKNYHEALKIAGDMWTARFNDGESLTDVKERVMSFFGELRKLPYKSILVVTHLSIIQILYGIIRGLSDEESLGIEIIQGDYIVLDI